MAMPSGRDASERVLVVVLAVLLGSFLVAISLAQRMSSRVAALSDSLAETAMPSIEEIASLRGSTLDVQLALTTLLHAPPDQRAHARAVLNAKVDQFEQEVRANFTGTTAMAESPPSSELAAALGRFENAVERTSTETDAEAARELFHSDVAPAANRLGDRAMREIETSARTGRELALRINETRARLLWLSYGLIGLCALVAVTGLVLVRRRNARRLAAVDAFARDQETKANEMEHFAGRVAHDIRGPLATAVLSAELLAAQVTGPESQHTIERLQRSVTRAAAITEGLLQFARAGAKPEPGARTKIRDVIDDLADGLSPELEGAGIELVVEPMPPLFVACSVGVFSSLLGNLVRNAIKYMGTGDSRRISIRAVGDGELVRIEVADTGPGIPAEIVPRLFEPYFRGTTKQVGLGLGLTTVRKLAEGHGGSVGVSSRLGQGSTFWFELPHAGTGWDSGDIEVDGSHAVGVH